MWGAAWRSARQQRRPDAAAVGWQHGGPSGHRGCWAGSAPRYGRRPPGRWPGRWQWQQHDLGAFAAHAQHPLAVLFAEIGDVGPGCFEDAQAGSPSVAISAKSHGRGDWRAAVSGAWNCRWVKPRVGDSGGTEDRWTCSAGECSSRPSITQVPPGRRKVDEFLHGQTPRLLRSAAKPAAPARHHQASWGIPVCSVQVWGCTVP